VSQVSYASHVVLEGWLRRHERTQADGPRAIQERLQARFAARSVECAGETSKEPGMVVVTEVDSSQLCTGHRPIRSRDFRSMALRHRPLATPGPIAAGQPRNSMSPWSPDITTGRNASRSSELILVEPVLSLSLGKQKKSG